MKETISFHIMTLYKDFLSYTSKALKEHGVNFGQIPLILYVGKHNCCSQANLTKALKLDWGYSQRCITKLVNKDLLIKEYNDNISCNALRLTKKGQEIFDMCHDVFYSWDEITTKALSTEEKEMLFTLLAKISTDLKED